MKGAEMETKTGAAATKKRLSFDSWMKMVDLWVGRLCGLSAADLPDVCFADWYDSGASSLTAAKRVVRMADGMDG